MTDPRIDPVLEKFAQEYVATWKMIFRRRSVRADLYTDFDVRKPWPSVYPSKPISGDECLMLARKLWRQACGKAWEGSWGLGRGNHRTYPRRGCHFLVNPHQTWRQIVHDMSHAAYSALTGQRYSYVEGDRTISPKKQKDYEFAPMVEHCDDHAQIERSMLATVFAYLEKKHGKVPDVDPAP